VPIAHRGPSGGRSLRLPDAPVGRFGVVLYYRRSWCPYRNAQLSAFQRSLDSLADDEIEAALPATALPGTEHEPEQDVLSAERGAIKRYRHPRRVGRAQDG
jgi:hypothetical protein